MGKEAHYTVIKESILQEAIITVLTIYVPNNGIKICEAKAYRIDNKNRQICYYSWRLQYSLFSN